jgi:hypothetical protein
MNGLPFNQAHLAGATLNKFGPTTEENLDHAYFY